MGMMVGVFRGLSLAGLVLASLLFGLLAGLPGERSVAYAQSASQIVVQGNRRVEADTIRSYFHPPLNAQSIDNGLKALYATNLFQDVRISEAGGRLIVTVVENPVINKVAFEGNHKAKDEQLLEEIQSKPRGTFSRAVVQADVQRIVDIYQHTGRYDVRVEPKIIELPNNRVDLVFEINEGGHTGVNKIAFIGNRHYSDWRLKDVIKSGETNWLSWIKSNDNFDPDRVEADRDLLRRFYLKNGFADVRIVSALTEYDPAAKGFNITFTIEEGERYKVASINLVSNVAAVNADALRYKLRLAPGDIYNADAVEKTVEDVTIETARRGYPFALVRPRGDRDFQNHTVSIVFVIEEGQRAYVERINIRGNTRTRDYVIRREFDLVEGDAYNKALVDRAEKRLKALNFFKAVKITTEPGSAPDRIILNVDVEEQSTGEFSFSGGYSTSDGMLGEISVGERNLLGRGQAVRAALQYGQRAKGVEVSFVEPFMFDTRLAMGIDLFDKMTNASSFQSYSSNIYGGNVRFGVPLTDTLTGQVRYSPYWQHISLPNQLQNCNNINPDFINTFPDPAHWNTNFAAYNAAYLAAGAPAQYNCYQDGEAALPIKMELSQGTTFVSLAGYGFTYNTLDNTRSPTSGVLVTASQDVAGLGGDVDFIKTTMDSRMYSEVYPDVVGTLRMQAGYMTGYNGQFVRVLDAFQGGPNLVRGFAPQGFGPRDLTPGTNGDALGGKQYWATSLEFQTPFFLAPKDFGMRLAAYADAGMLWGFNAPTFWGQTGENMIAADDTRIRSSVGVGLLWDSPLGPLRFDLAYALTREPYDHTQIFRFGGGSKF
jgi:outer membrane protein insertion porin family